MPLTLILMQGAKCVVLAYIYNDSENILLVYLFSSTQTWRPLLLLRILYYIIYTHYDSGCTLFITKLNKKKKNLNLLYVDVRTNTMYNVSIQCNYESFRVVLISTRLVICINLRLVLYSASRCESNVLFHGFMKNLYIEQSCFNYNV